MLEELNSEEDEGTLFAFACFLVLIALTALFVDEPSFNLLAMSVRAVER